MPPSPAIDAPTFPGGKAAPKVGARQVGLQVIHVDAVLAQQGQHILRRADQLGDGPVLQRQTQGAETVLVVGRFRELQRLDEIRHGQGRAPILGRGTKRQRGLFGRRLGLRLHQRGLAVSRRHRQCEESRREVKVANTVSACRDTAAISSILRSTEGFMPDGCCICPWVWT
jgi:hypothetical protein